MRTGMLWDGGVIPYEFDVGFPLIDSATEAMNIWTDEGPISFRPKEPEDADFVFFARGGNASDIGRLGGQQVVLIRGIATVGEIVHELGHVIGLMHEHCRPDRDDHIQVHLANIILAVRSQYEMSQSNLPFLGAYDYASVMHYGAFDNAIDPSKRTITTTPVEMAIGDWERGPSRGDRANVLALYG